MAEAPAELKIIATNRKARFEYEIFDRFEAGIALVGSEVKSLRAGQANLSDAYAILRRGEVFLVGAYIAPYKQAAGQNVESRRERKLLLHRAEIRRLKASVAERGFTLIPLQIYFKSGRVKLEIAVARGQRRHDKRETIRRRETARELQRATRGRGRAPR